MNEELLSRILKRSGSMFAEDLESHRAQIEACIRGARIMVIGAAGSIGSAFVRQLVAFRPAALHLVDISENNLVEVVRDLRSALISLPEDFKTFAVAMGSLEFDRLLDAERAYDYVINFSALKHVRSEKDPFSLMRMVHTNVEAVKALLDRLVGTSTRKHFSVSSDKAANPANIMGATKIFMERVLLNYADRIPFSTARFANVAFSDGSLLHGFLQRLAKGQPFAAPYDVRRYFISHEEAGQLCLLSCFLGENRDIYFPKLDEGSDLLTFAEIAVMVLEAHGFEPDLCASEEEAKEKLIRDRNHINQTHPHPNPPLEGEGELDFNGDRNHINSPMNFRAPQNAKNKDLTPRGAGIIPGAPPTDPLCEDATAARVLEGEIGALSLIKRVKSWPCYFFASDTTGEKPYEEFYTVADAVNLERYRQVGVISQPPWTDREKIDQALAAFARIREQKLWHKEEMVEAIKIIVPELEHEEKGKNLDQKM